MRLWAKSGVGGVEWTVTTTRAPMVLTRIKFDWGKPTKIKGLKSWHLLFSALPRLFRSPSSSVSSSSRRETKPFTWLSLLSQWSHINLHNWVINHHYITYHHKHHRHYHQLGHLLLHFAAQTLFILDLGSDRRDLLLLHLDQSHLHRCVHISHKLFGKHLDQSHLHSCAQIFLLKYLWSNIWQTSGSAPPTQLCSNIGHHIFVIKYCQRERTCSFLFFSNSETASYS